MKALVFSILIASLLFISCQQQPGPQPSSPTNNNNSNNSNNTPSLNGFEQRVTGTWKVQYRIRETSNGTGSMTYDTIAAPDSTWTVTFSQNNPISVSGNNTQPYYRDASGKMEELQNVSGGQYELHHWYGLDGTDSPSYSQYTGSIYMDGYGTCISTCYYGVGKLTITIDYHISPTTYMTYVLKKQ